jgi:hypothetical protein
LSPSNEDCWMSGRCSGPRAAQCRRSPDSCGSFWRIVRGAPRIPHERTALPEVQRADEACAGPVEHAPTGNRRRACPPRRRAREVLAMGGARLPQTGRLPGDPGMARPSLDRPQDGIELSAHHYPVHDCTQQVVFAVSHGRAHERIDLALRYTRLVHGFGDRAKNAELFASLPTSLTRTLGYLGAVPAARCH